MAASLQYKHKAKRGLLLVIRRPSYKVYDGRHTPCLAAVVQRVLRPPYNQPISVRGLPLCL